MEHDKYEELANLECGANINARQEERIIELREMLGLSALKETMIHRLLREGNEILDKLNKII